MMYWLLTSYAESSIALYTGAGLIILSLFVPFPAAWLLGTQPGGFNRSQLHILLPPLLVVALAAMHLGLPLAGFFALQRTSIPSDHPILSMLLGPPAYDSTRLALGSGLIVGLGLVAAILMYRQLDDGGWIREMVARLRDPWRERGEHGSATFVTPGQMAFLQRDKGDHALAIQGKFWGTARPQTPTRHLRRIDLGRNRNHIHFSTEDQARGTALIGPPGTGKSQAGILPILADSMASGQSVIVLDPQSELLKHVQSYAQVTGHRLIVHDPTDPTTKHFNLADGIEDVAEAQAIATILIPSKGGGGGGSHFWEDSARNLFGACLLRFNTLSEILKSLDDKKQLADKLAKEQDSATGLAAAFIANAQGDGKTAEGILAQLHTSALANWAEPKVQQSTDTTQFDAQSLIEQPTAIVLKCPGRYMKVYGPYLAAIMNKLMLDLDSIGEQTPGGALPRPVKIIIDEFPVMGKLNSVVEAVNLFRKRRISFVIALQSIAQLHNIYGRAGAETLISGMATQIIFGSCDQVTARYVVSTLGKATQQTQINPSTTTNTRQNRQRELMTIDEVITPPHGNCTLLFRYATTTYATQVVMLAQLRYMFERDDWQRVINQTPAAPPTTLTITNQSPAQIFQHTNNPTTQPNPGTAQPDLFSDDI